MIAEPDDLALLPPPTDDDGRPALHLLAGPLNDVPPDAVLGRLDWALRLARAGFQVISCWSTTADGTCRCRDGDACTKKPGKHPVAPDGRWHETTDEATIRTLLAAGSEPNYGVVPPLGCLALDVDGAAVATIARLEGELGTLPATYEHRTRNGRHLFYRWPAAVDRPDRSNLFDIVTRWGGLDGLPGRGYVIGPGSRIGAFTYGASGAPEGIAELPETWARAALIHGRAPRPDVSMIATGGRHPELRDAARYLRGRGFEGPALRAAIGAINAALPEPKADPDVDRAIGDVERKFGPDHDLARDVDLGLEPVDNVGSEAWAEPENRGLATLSDLGTTEYIDDLVRPGRIVTWAAEEGAGKSYAVAGELAIRVAIAGGSFAGTWPVLQTGPVLYLSEMHGDDDYVREDVVLAALGTARSALDGRYWRLPLMTAAGGRPALTVPEWRTWITEWLRSHEALLMIVDTATGATQVDPWGRAIQEVYAGLRLMLADYPALAIILIVHVRKPMGRGERRLSDVLGEWGRWCDVVVMQENDGATLDRAKITVRKRVRQERRIVATKAAGLLVDPRDMAAGSTKVPADDVVAFVAAHPGCTYAEIGAALEVSKDTASNYVKALASHFHLVPTGPKRQIRVYTTAEPPNTAEHVRIGGQSAVVPPSPPSAEPTYIGSAVGSAVGREAPTVAPAPAVVVQCQDYDAHRFAHRLTADGWICETCVAETQLW